MKHYVARRSSTCTDKYTLKKSRHGTPLHTQRPLERDRSKREPIHSITKAIAVVVQRIKASASNQKAPDQNLMQSESKLIRPNALYLRKGDPLPPFNGKLRVYNMRYCPFAQRTILALNAKGLDYEVVNIDPVDQPDWFMTKSLFGQLPAVEVAVGVTLCESLVIVNYIDDVYPQRPLRARDPLRHAHDQMLIEALTPMHTVLFKLVHAPATIDENVINAYFKALTYTQEQLKKRGTTFLSGNEPGYVDYMIWPWIEKMLAFQKVDARFKFDTPSYELLTKYAQKMIEDSTVNQYAVSDEIYLEAMDGYKSGKVFEYERESSFSNYFTVKAYHRHTFFFVSAEGSRFRSPPPQMNTPSTPFQYPRIDGC
ncbi:Pyrimidodiazepine synthase [Eumeta japonica]|uniref:Glutathione-dependent dehydroascorbate reductase n=1 Tax=Eumeta variegata TaxID=151549 RepID=A0A4C1TYK8_EUMVA|nr:Pyrimidodiazepine synthase [Eumeta japonica]